MSTVQSFHSVRGERLARQRDRSADIIICVHDALHVVGDCIASVLKHRQPERHRLILVDDGSAQQTREFLAAIARETPNVVLIRHEQRLGYTLAANIGLSASRAEFVLLLNSDTLVSASFLEKLCDAVYSTPGAGIVGAMSNAARGQSLPSNLRVAGQTMVNPLPPGMSAADMDRWCEAQTPDGPLPLVPSVYGFCFGMTRETIERVGLFDEVNFARGYGEEDDYCFRASALGIGMVIATHTYVFHHKNQSYGIALRDEIAPQARARLAELYGAEAVQQAYADTGNHPALAKMRAAAMELFGRAPGRPYSSVRAERIARQQGRRVDIIICVRDAPHVVLPCIESVLRYRHAQDHRLILVDDGSTAETSVLLEKVAREVPNVVLIRRDQAGGYTIAANAGLKASSAEFVLLLNSDTLVSNSFVEKLCDAVYSTPGAGIVGALSNAARGQSLPSTLGTADQTAINPLPPGMTPGDMDRWCELQATEGALPRVPLVHGFCFGVTRETIDRLGYFDEANFPRGYGEEDDYCLRAVAAGIGLVIATHTYVFHHKSQSYGPALRKEIVETTAARLEEIYGAEVLRQAYAEVESHPALRAMRAAAAELYAPKPG